LLSTSTTFFFKVRPRIKRNTSHFALSAVDLSTSVYFFPSVSGKLPRDRKQHNQMTCIIT
jgi:hypothetical protein